MASDYTMGTGSGGLMMIRDHGAGIEFFIKAGSTNTFVRPLRWNYIVNGVSGSGEVDYPSGGQWLHVASFNVTTSQQIKFGILATGTSGLGGPTDFYLNIARGGVPPAPTQVFFSTITGTSILTHFNGQGDGGSPITDWQLGYSSDANAGAQLIVSSGGTLNVTGLVPGTTYYFWARGVNAYGPGPWSPIAAATTHNYPPAPTAPVLSLITQRTMRAQFVHQGDGGSPILEWQLAYGLEPAGGQIHVTTPINGIIDLASLAPASTYYFWARGRNAVGWGAWSARSSARTIAGARIKVAGVWREAVPYVKVNGVWRVAQPYVKVGDTWRKTI